MPSSLATIYPNIARFVVTVGRIEIGYHRDFPVTSFIRAIEEGGIAWEGRDEYPSLDASC